MAVVFFDDFLGTSLGPDWTIANNSSRNGTDETEYYQTSQVTLDNSPQGNLVLTALCLDPAGVVAPPPVVSPSGYPGQTFNWYSGEVDGFAIGSAALFDQGSITWRAKMPSLAGMWPALWLVPSGSRTPPEIDVLEIYGGNPPENVKSTYITSYSPETQHQLSNSTGIDLSQAFHEYRMDWTSTGFTFWVDDLLTGTTAAGQPGVLPISSMAPIMNLAVAGTNGGGFLTPVPATGTGGGQIPPGTTVKMLIDWVRIEQNNPNMIDSANAHYRMTAQ